MKSTACPLDCFDACKVIYEDNKLKPSRDFITNGKLCVPFALMNKEKNLQDKNINNTLETLVKKLKEPNKSILYYKGTGNMGVMQNIPKLFFEKAGATFASGGICDEAGASGIEMGRKYNVNPDIDDLLQSEYIIVWGRNLTQTSKHIYNLIKDKKFITIDPVQIPIAKESEFFFQLKPKGDYLFASLLLEYLQNQTINFTALQSLNINKEDFINVCEILEHKKVSFMLGLGAQKYKKGAQIFHEMDKLFFYLGLFEGRNKGVWYLGDSKYRFDDNISISPTKTCGYADVKFDEYDIVFIQGANPVCSAMNTQKIKKSFLIHLLLLWEHEMMKL